MRVLGSYIRFIDGVILVNIIVYIMGLVKVLSPCKGVSWTACYFGLIPGLVFSEPWRTVTSMFVHGGLDHLIMNMLALYFFGMYVEHVIGERELIKLYFIGGIGGSLMYLLFALIFPYEYMNNIVVGASGALFALGAALAVLKPHTPVIIFPLPIPMELWKAEIIIFLFLSFVPGVAWEGHLGGLLVGVIYGYLYKKRGTKTAEVVYFTRRYY